MAFASPLVSLDARRRPVRSLVIGIARHGGTEGSGLGASPGTRLLFSLLERSLRQKCSLRRLPPYFYGIAPRQAVEIAEELLGEVDALVLSLPPHPADLEALFLVRRQLRRRIPFVYLPLGEFPRGAWFYRHFHQYLGPDDLIWFSSAADRQVHDLLVASPRARIRVLPFGIDLAPYSGAAATRATTRRHLGINHEEVVFVVHGRLDPEKNVHGVAAVFGEVARRAPACRLWVVGPVPGDFRLMPGPHPLAAVPAGPYKDLLAAGLGGDGAGRVSFWGGVPQELLPRVLAAADIGVNLTVNRDENFGFSVVEAMAAGLPVIGTDWGGLRDTIDDGVTGFRVPTVVTAAGIAVDHPAAVRHALDLAADGPARRRMGEAAAARARDRYAIDQCADHLLLEVRRLLARPRPARPHRWTSLGLRLVQEHSVRLSGAGSRSFPLPLPPAALDERARAIIRPYATRTQDLEPDPGAVVLLASPLIRCDGRAVTSADPAYPIDGRLAGPADLLVCRVLAAEGPVGVRDLLASAAGTATRQEVLDALRRLLAAGVVLQSREPAPACHDTGKDEAHVDPRNRR
ncbi:glycosyltransferase family 4 protein [Sphaerisporangium fuscum]|uniref:glycosyltransferase family 4 protein n=1 Tax=Sphaerisporangium fuscum TaxID=2835868 RepID=UPI0020299B45|nr:glycosyltransferase family 4 protein [Sphaerisporangium fuscum]